MRSVTGDTFFEVIDLKVHLGENVFLPNGALNQLRRDAFSMLQEKMLESYYRCSEKAMGDEKSKNLNGHRNVENEPTIVCLTEKRELLSVLLKKEFVSAIYLDFAAYGRTHFIDELAEDVAKIKKAKKQAFFAMPRIFRNEIADWFVSLANDLQNLQLDGILVRGYEELAYCRQYLPKCKMITDQNVYTYNDRAQQFFAEAGVWANTVPIELNRGEIMHRDNQRSEMIVYGYYPEKKHSAFRNFGSWVNYISVRILIGKPKELKTSSYWVARKFVRDSVIEYQAPYAYIQGLFLRTTRNISCIPIQHFQREEGESNYTFKRLLKLWSNIIGFSITPLRLTEYCGFGLSLLSIIAAVVVLIRKILNPAMALGWPSLMIVICFFSGIQLMFLGLIGEYIGRMFLGLNRQPQYVIREVIRQESEEQE